MRSSAIGRQDRVRAVVLLICSCPHFTRRGHTGLSKPGLCYALFSSCPSIAVASINCIVTHSPSDTRLPQPVVEVVNLHKRYPLFKQPFDRLRQLWQPQGESGTLAKAALRDVSLQIYPGQVFGIVGRNGSGKSTLLRLIAEVVKPSAGSVRCRGRVAALLELGAGFNPEFSGRDNVIVCASLLGIDEPTTLSRMAEIETFADIGEYFERPVKTYSSGMYARVAFAVMAVCDPDVLILDEILAVGDEAFQRKCLARIEQLATNGCAVILVTHNSQLVLEFCEVAALIDDGSLVAFGDPKSVIHEYYEPPAEHDATAESNSGEASLTAPPSYLDPALPQSAPVSYGDGGAQITDLRVIDERGISVNVLRRGSHYSFCYRVHFSAAVHGVEFGSLIKTRTGVEVGGMLLGKRPELARLGAGQTVEVRLPFTCRLLPNNYFFNAGVRAQASLEDRSMRYLHRVMDALMFQVQAETDLAVTGIVDLSNENQQPSVALE